MENFVQHPDMNLVSRYLAGTLSKAHCSLTTGHFRRDLTFPVLWPYLGLSKRDPDLAPYFQFMIQSARLKHAEDGPVTHRNFIASIWPVTEPRRADAMRAAGASYPQFGQ